MRAIPAVLLMSLCSSAVMLSAAPAGPWAYPPSKVGSVVDDYHGTRVADPYRWLEELDSPETAAWVAAQNRLTQGFLGSLPGLAAFRERLTRLWNYPRAGVPFREGGRTFFTRNSGLQNQSVLFVQDRAGVVPRVLIDPNTLASDGTVALTSVNVSRDGRLLAYGTAAAGSDWNEIRVRSIDDGRDTADHVKWVKFSALGWTRDGKGFFYSRYPTPEVDAGTGKTFSRLENHSVYYHRLGTPQEQDVLIHAIPAEPKWLVRATTSEDGRYVVIRVNRGSASENLLRYIDLGDPLAPRFDAPVVPLIADWSAEHEPVGNDGAVWYVLTTHGAPRRRLVAVDLNRPQPEYWREIVPEGRDVIDAVEIIGGRFVVRSMRDASSRLAIHAKDGRALGEVALPGIGTVGAVSGREDEEEFFYSFTSFATPVTNFRHNVATNRGAAFDPPAVAFNPGDYETRQVFFASKDGTRVPMFITHRKGLKTGPDTPALLYAYGGFNVSLTPSFSVANLVWMEAGGVYALPNLRGGGEYGRDWHQAGTKERKQNVFDDYIAAAEWLFANNCTSPGRLVLSGGSNGGLLVGAVVNQRPDLCRVAWPAVGVMDMLRFHTFTIGHAWRSDYGSSEDPAGFRYLRAYSPVHTVRAGERYPAVLVTTADHDDRVHPGHSFKYAAAMQAGAANGADASPVLIRIETRAGHGAGKPTSKVIEEAADKLAFAAHFVGLPAPR